MQTDTDKIREQLLTNQAELKKRVDRIHDHARNPLNADSAEQVRREAFPGRIYSRGA